MRLRLMLWAVVISCALVPLPVLAHHGWSGNAGEEFELTGTVASPVSLSGPHATMKVKASDGQVWELTLAPPARTERAGLTEKVIPVGATVTAHGHRNRDAKRFEIKTERVTWNGRTFNVYPDRQ
jgi:Family of unknown function (DUF6152)